MGIEKKVISLRLDEEFIQELREYAREENRTLSNYIEMALKQHTRQAKGPGSQAPAMAGKG